MAAIELKRVVKKYENAVTAVDHVDLHIRDKEFLVLVGPSGCGKSTVLRMLAGLEDITEGEMYIGGNRVNDLAPKDRNIAMVFQNYALYPHMNVYKNMEFGLKMRKLDKAVIRARILETAKQLQIEELLLRRPAQLSGGQRQRVALGRAMVREPEVFLLDEPLSNLDAKLRTEMRVQISRLHKQLQTTFVYVTHDQTEAMTMADRIVVMKDGVIQQIDTPRGVYQNPANLFVAGFIGSPRMNFFPVELHRGSRGTPRATAYFMTFCGREYELPGDRFPEAELGLCEGKEIIAGIRPEELILRSDDCPCPCILGRATVLLREDLGPELCTYLDYMGYELTVKTAHRHGGPSVGQQIDPAASSAPSEQTVGFHPRSLHLFYKEEGTAVKTV